MSKNILHALKDGLRAFADAIEADAAEQTAAVEAPEETAAAVENVPQEATEAPQEATEQEAAHVETMEAEETAATAEIITEVENDTEDKTTLPDDFNDRLKKAMEILKGRKS